MLRGSVLLSRDAHGGLDFGLAEVLGFERLLAMLFALATTAAWAKENSVATRIGRDDRLHAVKTLAAAALVAPQTEMVARP